MDRDNLFKGLWPALFTPVDENEMPELDQLCSLCELLINQGIDGLYVLGSTGQGVLFQESDRKQVLDMVMQVVGNRVPVMVQVGALTTRASINLAEHAAKSGVAAVSSVGPIYFSGGPNMAIQHYTEIAKAAQLPFFPYQLGNNSIPGNIDSFIERVLEIPFIEGMKLTTGNLLEISRVQNCSQGRLKLFSGADELMCQAALSGTVGAIGTFYNLWGSECKFVLEEFKQGNFNLAETFMLQFQQVIDRVLPNIWTFLRQAMIMKHSIDIGATVSPLGRGQTPWANSEVASILDDIDKVLKG
ncbi:dihydrodipicolinate synthase family protein [Sphingobacterium sp. SYP-B4668]|uniref:dihydrodipicolinate synthase family protein n=1 Tax=Sphingobacterium sp. SYP-B4668 TaxID=2996035 RepID=UPI0022DDCD28|nr:dihydrodipicolinate synthase family protein [Sphingobacterium sp. SYP-B4668]